MVDTDAGQFLKRLDDQPMTAETVGRAEPGLTVPRYVDVAVPREGDYVDLVPLDGEVGAIMVVLSLL